MLSEECNFCLEKNTPHFFHQQGQSLYSTLSMCLISSASESTTGTSGQVKILKYCFIRWCMSASFCVCLSFRPGARAWYWCSQIHLLRAHIVAVVVPKCCKIFCYDNNYASPRFWNISSSRSTVQWQFIFWEWPHGGGVSPSVQCSGLTCSNPYLVKGDGNLQHIYKNACRVSPLSPLYLKIYAHCLTALLMGLCGFPVKNILEFF